MKLRRLDSTALDKVWGSPQTAPWYPPSSRKIGEVWFHAPEEPRLLLKFIFTSDKLSVQVHPPDAPDGTPGKTEMWHILCAGPGARLALGFTRSLTQIEVRQAALSGEIENLLRWYEVQPGDIFFVPAGTVHAIGAGIVLCEIQQYSDITYRLYDYGRPRELHLDAALAVAQLNSHPGPARFPVECPYFHTESLEVTADTPYTIGPQAEYLVCLEGSGSFDAQPFAPGEVWIAPHGGDAFTIRPHTPAGFLHTYVP